MEQRFQDETHTETKQYGPKVEAFISGVLAVATAPLVIFAFV